MWRALCAARVSPVARPVADRDAVGSSGAVSAADARRRRFRRPRGRRGHHLGERRLRERTAAATVTADAARAASAPQTARQAPSLQTTSRAAERPRDSAARWHARGAATARARGRRSNRDRPQAPTANQTPAPPAAGWCAPGQRRRRRRLRPGHAGGGRVQRGSRPGQQALRTGCPAPDTSGPRLWRSRARASAVCKMSTGRPRRLPARRGSMTRATTRAATGDAGSSAADSGSVGSAMSTRGLPVAPAGRKRGTTPPAT